MSEFQDKKAVICFFIAESVVLFASKESDSNRSELTKQVTAAQLAIAFRQSLQARPTTSEVSFSKWLPFQIRCAIIVHFLLHPLRGCD